MIPIAGYRTVGQQTPRRVTRTLQIAGNPVRVVFDEAKLRRLSSRFKGAYNTAKDRIPARFAARLVADPDYSEEIKLSLTSEQQREFLRWAEAVTFRGGYRRNNPVLAALDGQNNVFGSWEPAETPGLVSRGQLLEFDLTRPTVAVTKTIVVERDLPAVVGTAVYRLQVDNGDRVAGGQPVPSSLQEQLYSLPAYGATSLEELRRTTTVETPASAIITTVAGSAHYQFRRDQAILAAWERLPEFTRALTEAIVWEATDTALLTTLLARLLPPFACGVPPVYSFLDRQRVFAPSSVDSPVARMVAIFAALTLLVEPFGGDDPGVDTRQLLRYYLPGLNTTAAPLGDQDDVLRANFPDTVDPNWLRASTNIGVFLNPPIAREVETTREPRTAAPEPRTPIGPRPPLPAEPEIPLFFTDEDVKRQEPPFPPTFKVTDLPDARVRVYREPPHPEEDGPHGWERQRREDIDEPLIWIDSSVLEPGQKYEYIFRASRPRTFSFASRRLCNRQTPNYRDDQGRAQDCVFKEVLTRPSAVVNVQVNLRPDTDIVDVRWEGGTLATAASVLYTLDGELRSVNLAYWDPRLKEQHVVLQMPPGSVLTQLRVAARNEQGAAAVGESPEVVRVPPGLPARFQVRTVDPARIIDPVVTGDPRIIDVYWDATPGAVRYELQRRVNGEWSTVADTTGIGYTDEDTEWGRRYVYRVRSISAAGVPSRWSPTRIGETAPAPPDPVDRLHTNVSANRAGISTLRVAWSSVPRAEGYRVAVRTPVTERRVYEVEAPSFEVPLTTVPADTYIEVIVLPFNASGAAPEVSTTRVPTYVSNLVVETDGGAGLGRLDPFPERLRIDDPDWFMQDWLPAAVRAMQGSYDRGMEERISREFGYFREPNSLNRLRRGWETSLSMIRRLAASAQEYVAVDGRVRLSWGAGDADEYIVARGPIEGGAFTEVGRTVATEYDDQVPPNKLVRYRVTPVLEGVHGIPQFSRSAVLTPPPLPDNIRSSVHENRLDVDWTKPQGGVFDIEVSSSEDDSIKVNSDYQGVNIPAGNELRVQSLSPHSERFFDEYLPKEIDFFQALIRTAVPDWTRSFLRTDSPVFRQRVSWPPDSPRDLLLQRLDEDTVRLRWVNGERTAYVKIRWEQRPELLDAEVSGTNLALPVVPALGDIFTVTPYNQEGVSGPSARLTVYDLEFPRLTTPQLQWPATVPTAPAVPAPPPVPRVSEPSVIEPSTSEQTTRLTVTPAKKGIPLALAGLAILGGLAWLTSTSPQQQKSNTE